MSQFRLKVMVIGIRFDLNLFHLYLVLRLFALFLFFSLLISKFSKIDNLANRWVCRWGDLYEIKPDLFCTADGIHQR